MRRLRIAGLALLALAVPPFALGGEEAPSGPAELSVSASLGGCGLAKAAIVCEIDTSWSPLEGADHYTVSVTRPDGSVIDAGEVAGTGRSVFVPYVGPGTYAVEVAAWGTAPDDEEPEVLVREKTLSTSSDIREGAVSQQPGESGPSADGRGTVGPGAVTDEPGIPHADEPPACDDPVEDPADEHGADEVREPAAEASAADDLAADDEDTRDAEEPDAPPVCP